MYSYLLHGGVKPTTVTFKNGLPSTGEGFFTSTGNYYGKVNTPTTGRDHRHPQQPCSSRRSDHEEAADPQDPALRHRQQERGLGGRDRLRQHEWCGHRLLEHGDHVRLEHHRRQQVHVEVPVFITTVTLPSVKPGAKVSDSLHASGGKSPYTWATTKALPSGLKLNTAGLLSGTVAKIG